MIIAAVTYAFIAVISALALFVYYPDESGIEAISFGLLWPVWFIRGIYRATYNR